MKKILLLILFALSAFALRAQNPLVGRPSIKLVYDAAQTKKWEWIVDTNNNLTINGTGGTPTITYSDFTGTGTRLGAFSSTGVFSPITNGTDGQFLSLSSGVPTWVASPTPSGAALTRTNDTNVTLTLGGSPSTALLNAASLTLGWTGTLSVARGGSGAATLTGYLKGNGTSAFTASSTIPNTDISGLGTMSTQNTNSVAVTGGTINNTVIGGTTAAAGSFTTVNSTAQIKSYYADPVLLIQDLETDVTLTNSRLRLAESGGSGTLGSYWDVGMIGREFQIERDGVSYLQINTVTNAVSLPQSSSFSAGAGSFSSLTLTTDLSVANGGTGASTLTGVLIGNGTSAVTGTTTSSGISGAISDETGTGALVFGTAPTFTTSISTPSVISASGDITLDPNGTANQVVFTDGQIELQASGQTTRTIGINTTNDRLIINNGTSPTAGNGIELYSTGRIILNPTNTTLSGIHVSAATSNYGFSIFNGGSTTSNDGLNISCGLEDHTAAGPSTLINFQDANSTDVGSITFGSSATAYNTTSDYRLKEDFKDFDGLSLAKSIPVYNYRWKGTKDSYSYGVKAHELQEVLPYAVTGEKDAVDENGEAVMQQADYSKLVPILLKSIQELEARVVELEKRVSKK